MKTISETFNINWEKAYEYKAYQDVIKLLRDEIHRRRGATMLTHNVYPDPSHRHFEAIFREMDQRAEQLHGQAYPKETVSEETNPDRSSSETSTDSTGH